MRQKIRTEAAGIQVCERAILPASQFFVGGDPDLPGHIACDGADLFAFQRGKQIKNFKFATGITAEFSTGRLEPNNAIAVFLVGDNIINIAGRFVSFPSPLAVTAALAGD